MRDPDLLFGLGSTCTRSGGHFTLFDLDTEMSSGHLVAKKLKTSPSIPTTRASINLIVITPGSRKRKNSKAADLCLENLNIENSLGKLTSFSQVVS